MKQIYSKKLLGIICILLTTLVSLTGCFFQDDFTIGGNGGDDTPTTLNEATNVFYDDKSCVLSWDAVPNADKYVVEINGEQHTTDTNSLFFIPKTDTTSFKIRAVNSAGEYFSSDWSKEITYTVPNTFNLAKVQAFVNEMLEGRSVEKIVSMYVAGGDLYTTAVMSDEELYKVHYDYASDVTSIEDAMEHTDLETLYMASYELAPYDSAKYLLQSESLAGELELRRQEGWNISVVASQAVKDPDSTSVVYIFATYKLDNGFEVKYVESYIKCIITTPSQTESINFTTKLINEKNRKIREISYVELTGDEFLVAHWLDEANNGNN